MESLVDVKSLPSTRRAQLRLAVLLGRVSVAHLTTVLVLRRLLRRYWEAAAADLRTVQHTPAYMHELGVTRLYRAENKSVIQSLLSALYLHNESWNIHSHAAAAMFFGTVFMRRLRRWYTKGRGIDLRRDNQSAVLLLYLMSATTVFGVSTVAHLFGAHSRKVHLGLFQLDHVAIFISFVFNTVATGSLEFNQRSWRRFLFNVATFATFCITYIASRYREPTKFQRVALLVTMGSLSVMPISSQVMHAAWKGHHNALRRVLWYTMTTFTPVIMGAGAYAAQFPERHMPSGVGSELSSYGFTGHGLMHVLVAVGMWSGYLGLKTWNRYLPYELKNIDMPR